ILAFLSRRRQGGASIRDLVHSLAVPPSRRVEVKRLLEALKREGLVRRGGHGKFVLTGNGGTAPSPRPAGPSPSRPSPARPSPAPGAAPSANVVTGRFTRNPEGYG